MPERIGAKLDAGWGSAMREKPLLPKWEEVKTQYIRESVVVQRGSWVHGLEAESAELWMGRGHIMWEVPVRRLVTSLRGQVSSGRIGFGV